MAAKAFPPQERPQTHTVSALRPIISALADEDGEIREKNRAYLVKIGGPAVPALIRALASKKPQIRWEAAKAMYEIKNPSSAPALVAALEDEEFDVRWLAAEALIILGKPAVAPILNALIKDSKSYWLQRGAHHVLGHFAGTDYKIEHHLEAHPAEYDLAMIKTLAPVVEALGSPEASIEAPLAAVIARDSFK